MQFLDKVVAKGTLRRTETFVPQGRERGKIRKEWVNRIWKEPKEGILIGWRWLSDGEVEYSYDDEPPIYYKKLHFKVALVLFNERENPKYVPINLLERIEK